MSKLSTLTASILCLSCPAAPADVVQSAADGALIQHHFQIAASPKDAWSALVHPEHWWPADHTWSGRTCA
jgi:hypothetical protein